MGRVAAGSIGGAALAAFLAPLTKPWFSVPTGGVGWVTVNHYPKGWDYAVVAMLVGGAFLGGVIAAWTALRPVGIEPDPRAPAGSLWQRLILAALVFVLMFFLHDHPQAPMDPFHEGEHLTAGWLMKSGERPYRDFYIFHGLAVDAGLDALVLGDPPSPLRSRRLLTVLDAATMALLVPIAAEVATTGAGMAAGVILSMCATAAFWLPTFPYFRLAPVLLAVLALLRYRRSGSGVALFGAFAASSLGVLWSLDTGLYAVAGTAGSLILLRLLRLETNPASIPRVLMLAAMACLLPLVVLLAVRADLERFYVDSFVVMPEAIDAVWALGAPDPRSANGVRYYLPLVFYGFVLALGLAAWRRGERRTAASAAIVLVFSLLLFRTAAGRVGWGHTRFAMPLLGIAVVAFLLEPLIRSRGRRAAAGLALCVPLFLYFEVRENAVAGAKLVGGWSRRQSTDGLVPYPFANVRGIFTSPQNAADLAALAAFLDARGPKNAPIFDFSNERALYFLLQRKAPTRVLEVSMMSNPRVLAETMAELIADPPVAVIIRGDPNIAAFDGVPNEVRVPELAAWIDANYPRRTEAGRFVVATR